MKAEPFDILCGTCGVRSPRGAVECVCGMPTGLGKRPSRPIDARGTPIFQTAYFHDTNLDAAIEIGAERTRDRWKQANHRLSLKRRLLKGVAA